LSLFFLVVRFVCCGVCLKDPVGGIVGGTMETMETKDSKRKQRHEPVPRWMVKRFQTATRKRHRARPYMITFQKGRLLLRVVSSALPFIKEQ